MIVEQAVLLPGLGQQRFEFLIVVIERRRPGLQFLIALFQRDLLLLQVLILALQQVRILSTAGQHQQYQGSASGHAPRLASGGSPNLREQ